MKNTTTILLVLLLSACGRPAGQTETVDSAAKPHSEHPSVYELAVANVARPDTDRARDAGRKPAEVLEFVGVKPGMTVLDMFSGAGYYTEILSHLVGDTGRVVAHSNAAYLNYVGEAFEQRYLGGRLANTEILMAENNALSLEPDSLDAIMIVLSFHDLYYVNPEGGWPEIDPHAFLAELHGGLRAGGVIGIVDHCAADGAPRETGGTTHRIDPEIVIEEMTKAGFVLDGRSEMLRNPDDDYDKSVFDKTVSGKTDRFVLRFRKPE